MSYFSIFQFFLQKQLLDPQKHIITIFLNSPSADGNRQGYALVPEKSLNLVNYADRLGLSLVAMGGAWDVQHFMSAAQIGFAGLAAANCFHYREAFPLLVKKHLKDNGFDVVI